MKLATDIMRCQRTPLNERIRIRDTEDRREIGGGGRMGIWRGQEMTDLRASMLLSEFSYPTEQHILTQ